GVCDDWRSPVVPELNGVPLELRATSTIRNVDAANGIVDIEFAGDLFAAARPPGVPAVTVAGFVLLLAGALGLGLWLLKLRSRPLGQPT
ncbi:MAG: hypothetical protein HY721_20965, partial [Planctomycetes bacterium]|nr:hypothetical protein [Planctomycetota bacterium]